MSLELAVVTGGLLFKEAPERDLSEFLSPNGLQGYVSLALDLKGLKQVLTERPQLVLPLNKQLRAYDLQADDLFRLFEGELAVAWYEEDKAGSFLLMAAIKDRPGLENLMERLRQQQLISGSGPMVSLRHWSALSAACKP